MKTPQIITLNTLISLPTEWMREFTTEKEAVDAATESGEPFIYRFLNKWFVVKKKETK